MGFSASFRPTKEFVVSEEKLFTLHENLTKWTLCSIWGLTPSNMGLLEYVKYINVEPAVFLFLFGSYLLDVPVRWSQLDVSKWWFSSQPNFRKWQGNYFYKKSYLAGILFWPRSATLAAISLAMWLIQKRFVLKENVWNHTP